MRDLLVLAVGVFAVLATGFGAAPPTGSLAEFSRLSPEKQRERIDNLIRQLGSDDYQIRETATRHLLSLDAAAPALRRALNATDAEVTRRAKSILTVFARRRQH